MGKGKVKYVPPKVLEGLETIKMNYNYNGENADAEAFKKMAEFVPIGIEIEKKWFTIFKKTKK